MQARHESTKRRATKPRKHETINVFFVFSCFRGSVFRVFVAACVALFLGASALAQRSPYPIYTVDHLNEAMKTVGLAFQLTTASVEKNDAENAKDFLARSREWLAPTITFWRNRQTEDAIALLRGTLKKLDALDGALSAEQVDFAAARSLVRDINASCESCHAKYREIDPATNSYRVRSDLAR
jgi:hypothetical protein